MISIEHYTMHLASYTPSAIWVSLIYFCYIKYCSWIYGIYSPSLLVVISITGSDRYRFGAINFILIFDISNIVLISDLIGFDFIFH